MREHHIQFAQNDNDPHPRPAARICDDYEKLEVAHHPFFTEMRQRQVDLSALWLLMANLQRGISSHFVRWLASVIERVDEPRIASLLAKQLNDELGNGDFRRIHSVLLQRFVDGLAPYRPQGDFAGIFTAGDRLFIEQQDIFNSNPWEGVGALMVSEIFAKKMDRCVGDEVRRQSSLSREVLTWLELHETLEQDHAEDSRELAALVPESGRRLSATWTGARAEWEALWGFLDDVRDMTVALRDSGTARAVSRS
jgi:pyrroloquinoline quinone (PQQ) biosynthesis protein C